jgi:hypothetical protein
LTYNDNPQGYDSQLLSGLGQTYVVSGSNTVNLKYRAQGGERVNFTVTSISAGRLSAVASMGGSTLNQTATALSRNIIAMDAPSSGEINLAVTASSAPVDSMFSVLTNSNVPIKNCTVGVGGGGAGLSTGAKAGIGVGVTVGIIGLLGTAGYFTWKHFHHPTSPNISGPTPTDGNVQHFPPEKYGLDPNVTQTYPPQGMPPNGNYPPPNIPPDSMYAPPQSVPPNGMYPPQSMPPQGMYPPSSMPPQGVYPPPADPSVAPMAFAPPPMLPPNAMKPMFPKGANPTDGNVGNNPGIQSYNDPGMQPTGNETNPNLDRGVDPNGNQPPQNPTQSPQDIPDLDHHKIPRFRRSAIEKHHHHEWLPIEQPCEANDCELNSRDHQCYNKDTCPCECRIENCPVTKEREEARRKKDALGTIIANV